MSDSIQDTIHPITVEGVSLIDFNVTTAASNRLVKLMIPELICVAVNHEAPITYGELSRRISHGTARIGYQLGCIIDVIEDLNTHVDFRVPALTGLCVSSSSQVPGKSVDRIVHNFSEKSTEEKIELCNGINRLAYDFDRWHTVRELLGL